MRRLVPAFILMALALPAPAHAASRQVRIFQDDRMLVYSGPVVRAAILDQAKALGVDVIRVQFVWRNIALRKPANPSDPASYGTSWSNWDSLVLDAHRRGLKVLATVTGPAPSWAAGTTGRYYTGSRNPDAKQFGKFVTAVGRRYSGNAKASSTARAHPAGLSDALQCMPIPPLITCDPGGNPVIGTPPPDGGGGATPPPPSTPPPPPPGSGDQSPPPPPGSGTPTPPPPPGTRLPKIGMWSIYNEPNHPLFVSPQRSKGVLTAPSIYRKLYVAGWNALARSGHRHDTILIGEVLPIGSNGSRATSTTSPLSFARELFCLNGKGKRHPGCSNPPTLHSSGWALHAYYRRTGPFSVPPGRDDLTPATVGRLRQLLTRAARKHRLAGSTALWDTEDGAQTRPPDPKGASLKSQARFINEAEYLAWRKPFVRSFSQYLWTDEDAVWAFQSGLTFANGAPKPALNAYRLPLFVKKAGSGVVVWGRAPARGQVTIVPSTGRRVTVAVKGTYFTKRLATRARSYRLRFGPWSSRSASPR